VKIAPIRLLGTCVLGVLVAVAACGWYVTHPALWPEFRQATALIAAVEHYKSAHGRVPLNASELPGQSESEEGPVFYQATDRDRYQVWFGRSVGESYTYDSTSRSWR
jgi:hypothetical protein